MKKMRCETIWAYGFILLAMTLLPLAGFGREEATPTPAVEQTWQALVEAARAEGKLVISSNSLHESLPQAFEKKYGIRTILEASSGREATNRLLAERRAGIHAVDIFIAGRGTMRSRLLPAGVLLFVISLGVPRKIEGQPANVKPLTVASAEPVFSPV